MQKQRRANTLWNRMLETDASMNHYSLHQLAVPDFTLLQKLCHAKKSDYPFMPYAKTPTSVVCRSKAQTNHELRRRKNLQ